MKTLVLTPAEFAAIFALLSNALRPDDIEKVPVDRRAVSDAFEKVQDAELVD